MNCRLYSKKIFFSKEDTVQKLYLAGTSNNVLVIEPNYRKGGKDVEKSKESESVYTRDIILCRGMPSFARIRHS